MFFKQNLFWIYLSVFSISFNTSHHKPNNNLIYSNPPTKLKLLLTLLRLLNYRVYCYSCYLVRLLLKLLLKLLLRLLLKLILKLLTESTAEATAKVTY